MTSEQNDLSAELKNLHYSHNAPKILLEVISARSALLILAATYISFLFSFAYDVNSTVQNFSGGINTVGTSPCDDLGIDETSFWKTGGKWGCTLRPYDAELNSPGIWVGRVGNLSNVISVALRFDKLNITSLQVDNVTTTVEQANDDENVQTKMSSLWVDYTLNLYACFHSNDCSKNADRGHKWHTVLKMKSFDNIVSDMFVEDYSEVHHSICGNTFQNQESLPNKGLVRSYLAIVEFRGNGVETVIDAGNDGSSNSIYEFLTISRMPGYHEDYLRPGLMILTISVAVSFIWSSYQHNPEPSTWLRERKWIVFYFVALIFYQNPPYILISCFHRFEMIPSSMIVYLAYACDSFGQASFFLLWLMFADGSKSRQHLGSFYVPKVFLVGCIFISNMAILTMQFPSLYSSPNSSFPTMAVYNWSHSRKILFIYFSLSFLSLLIVWGFMWYHTLTKTKRTLQKLPYMSTRYLQLSFQFFSLQASLVAIYYLFQYGVVIFLIFRNSSPIIDQHLNNLSDNVNTLFRHQTLLIGKVVFLTVYSIILAVLYLPASDSNRGGKVNEALRILSATYTVHEVEMNAVVRARRKAMRRKTALSNIVDSKAEVFCLNLALLLLDAANEAYYEVSSSISQESGTEMKELETETKWSERLITPSIAGNDDSGSSANVDEESRQTGSYGEANWERYGYQTIGQQYNALHDTYVYIGRHVESDKVIVSFRGTSSAKHWKNNLQYGLKEIDFLKLHLHEVDEADNLGDGGYIDLAAHGVDSESDFSDDDNDYDNCDDIDGRQQNFEEIKNNTEYNIRPPSHRRGRIPFRRERRIRKKKGLQHHNPVEVVADTVREVGGVVLGATSTVVGATTGLLTAAVAHTPIINKTVQAFVHSGFWDCYVVVRDFIHMTLRRELTISSGREVFFTGHSLGGVLACYAALDFTLHSKDRIDKFNRHSKLRDLEFSRKGHALKAQWQPRRSYEDVSVGMYSFGAPKPGNWMFSHIYDKVVPNSFRVVVDGDIVCGLPPTMGYQHIGTQVVIDKLCSGSIIVDPSFVERRFRTSTKTSLTAHILAVYKQSLLAVRDASLYIQQIGSNSKRDEGVEEEREEFNRMKRNLDDEHDDHFFLDKIYELLNKRTEENSQNSEGNNFSRLPQESSHSIDDSTTLDVSVSGSSWKSSSFGYDDTFVMNTSENGTFENIDCSLVPKDRSKIELAKQNNTTGSNFESNENVDNVFDDSDEDFSQIFSSLATRPASTLLTLPSLILKKSTDFVQNNIFGLGSTRVNENQVESMMLLQRSTMQRSEGGDDGRLYQQAVTVQLAPFANSKASL